MTLVFFCSYSQEKATVYGQIISTKNKPLISVNISVLGIPGGTVTDAQGKFRLDVPANIPITIFLTHISFKTDTIKLKLQAGENHLLNRTLSESSQTLNPIVVTDKKDYSVENLQKINPKEINKIPSATGGIEAVLKTLPGVHSSNDLSSQYSVRGGNFDENLVYVNDIEIYRPFLIRSGQQEGLSFVNSDLVSSVLFSAGGFEAKYGDKMSSVLDIKYKKPINFAGSASASLLGGSFHIEDAPTKRFTYLLGVRQKSNQYLLNSMETKGDYRPSFTDVQTFMTYNLSKKWDLSFLGNASLNKYRFIPQTRQTNFGTVNQALRLTIFFDGQEVDKFETYLGAISANYNVNNNLKLKFITSAFKTYENETFDIQGQYWLDELETDMGKKGFGDVAFNLGSGTYLNHARNYLQALVYNVEHIGILTINQNTLQWGIKYQREIIQDELCEWNMLDSADYTLPHSSDSVGYINPDMQPKYALELQDVVKTKTNISSNRISSYIQKNWEINSDSNIIDFNIGIRSSYWDFNKQAILTPRGIIAYKPNWKQDIRFRASAGYYYQPPFYREMRDFYGNVNKNLKAQKSVQFLLGSDWYFTAWNRPFKYVTEIYYKTLSNLVPYQIDNVRLRYYANNNSKGYATGIDMRVNGEFVKTLESWFSVSLMKTEEIIKNDFYYTYFNKDGQLIIPGYTYDTKHVDSIYHKPQYIPRPTDQRVTVSLFFQDYFPKYPSFKMHMTLTYGTALPFGPPGTVKYKDTLRMPDYRRVDIGFSYELKSELRTFSKKNPLKYFKSIWLSVEVFNLLQINNTVSYIWIKDVTNRQYAVPSYLTPRQLNVKLIVDF
ncbi:MAG: carboxypeptidase-like regulatory domain-containing protein [Bacteroidales bacterium]